MEATKTKKVQKVKVKFNRVGWEIYKRLNVFAEEVKDKDGFVTMSAALFFDLIYPLTVHDTVEEFEFIK